MELAFEEILQKHTLNRRIWFQSFLSWNWPLKIRKTGQVLISYKVSILLIVELAFEEGGDLLPFLSQLRFNPSYRGIGLWRPRDTAGNIEAPWVSILLIVELAFEADLRRGGVKIQTEFQSFLSWNWPLKLADVKGMCYDRDSFNPSYRGIGLWSRRVFFFLQFVCEFQSFLSWNWPLKFQSFLKIQK